MPVVTKKNFDITKVPQGTLFVLDTNVLFNVHSGYNILNQKTLDYSNIIQTIKNANYEIRVSVMSIQELFHIIENKEYKIYCKKNNLNKNMFSKKDYRKKQFERAALKKKLQIIMGELTSNYTIDNSSIDIQMLNSYIQLFETQTTDPIDHALTSNYNPQNTYFVTDDTDFRTISNITVVTA